MNRRLNLGNSRLYFSRCIVIWFNGREYLLIYLQVRSLTSYTLFQASQLFSLVSDVALAKVTFSENYLILYLKVFKMLFTR